MAQMYDTEVNEQASGAMPTFRMETVLDKKKSAETGCDHFTEQEWVEIKVRGDHTTIIDTPVNDSHRERFAASYQKFKAGKEQKYGDGYPLEQWAAIGAPMVKTLNAQDVFTVEQLAEFPDTFIHKLHQGQVWKQRAIQFLKDRNPDTENLRDDLDELKAQIAELKKENMKLKVPKKVTKKKRGRPRLVPKTED